MLTKENQGKKNEGHLVVRLPVVMRLAECSIRFLMAAVLAGAEMFGGFAMCGVAMVGASGPGTEGFAALLGACFGYLCFRGFVEGLRYVAASVLVTVEGLEEHVLVAHWPAIVLAVVIFVAMKWTPMKKLHPIVFIAIAAVVGAVFQF